MALDWNNAEEVKKRRQLAIKAGYKAKDIDEFIQKKRDEAATIKLGREGLISIEDLAKTNPQAALTLSTEGIKPKPSAKDQTTLSSINQFISNIEKNYQEAGGASFGAGPGARISGGVQGLLGKIGLNSSANVYNREKRGFAATLKTLTGDTGVLTEQDFQRLAGLLPDLGSNPEEAKKLLNDLRSQVSAKFGGQAAKTGINPKDSGVLGGYLDFALGGALKIARDTGAGINANLTEGRRNQATGQAEQVASQLEQQAMSTTDMRRRKDLLSQANNVRQGVSQQAQQVSQTFSPDIKDNYLGRALGGATQIATAAEVPGGIKSIISGAKSLPGKVFPSGTAKATRTGLIESATTGGKVIDGSKIAEHFTKWGEQAVRGNPGKEKQIAKIVDSVTNNFNGKPITPDQAMKMWLDADNGFNAQGVVKTALESKVDVQMREVLRPLIQEVAPGFDEATKAIAKGIKNKKLATWLAKVAGGAIASGASFAVLGSLLGQNKKQ